MKFSRKLILGLSLTLLCLSFAGVFAQSNTMTSVVSPTTRNLNSVFIVNNSTITTNDLTKADAWAVGDGGVICKWNGTGWSTVTSPTTTNLYNVFFNSNTMGWAVGGNATNGVIVRYLNGNWSVWNVTATAPSNTTQQNILNATLYSISMDSTGNVGWAVGANGSTFGFVNQSCFMLPSGTNATLRSVGMVHNSTDAWAVGDNGTIIAYSNSTGTGSWTKMTSPTNASLYSLQMINATTAWAVGGTSSNGAIIMLNGTTWSNFTKVSFAGMNATGPANDKVNATLYSVSANNATSAWAVGANGTVLYWGGKQWDGQMGVVASDLKGVSLMHGNFTSFAQAWAVGTGGKIIAWAGATWVPEIPIATLPALLCVGVAIAVLGKTRLFRKPLY